MDIISVESPLPFHARLSINAQVFIIFLSTTILSSLQEALLTYVNCTRITVAYLCEARFCEAAAEQCAYFVQAFESGRNDCGLFISPKPLDTRIGFVHTLHELLKDDPKAKTLCPYEDKSIMAIKNSKRGDFNAIPFSEDQVKSFQALFLVSPKEPNFVVFLPFHFVPTNKLTSNERELVVRVQLFRPLWTLHPFSEFPGELTPFILPVSQIGVALESTRVYIEGTTDSW